MIPEYLEYQAKVKNLSARTVNEYRKDLKVFVSWAAAQQLRWSTLTKADIDRYVMSQHDAGMTPATIKKRITAVRMLLQWAYRVQILPENVAQYVQSPKNDANLPTTAEVEQIDAYLSTPVTSERSARIHALAAIILESGLRLTEALHLKWRDLEGGTRTIKVRGKGGKERITIYGDRTQRALAELEYKSDLVFNFSSERECRREMTEEMAQYIPGVHPHMLRHTFATALVNNGANLKDISTLMGHAHTTTTEVYTRVAAKHLSKSYEQFHP